MPLPPPRTSSTSSSNVTSETESKGFGDMGWEIDYNLVKSALGTEIAKQVGTDKPVRYWLASRNYVYRYMGSINWYFVGRQMDDDGYLADTAYSHFLGGNDGSFSNTGSACIRPIVILKSGVIPSSGSGTSVSPYVLS